MTCDTFSFLGKILRFSTNGHVPKRRKFGRFKKYFKMRMCFTKMSEKIVWRFDQLRNFPRDFGMFTTQKFSDHFDSFFWHFGAYHVFWFKVNVFGWPHTTGRSLVVFQWVCFHTVRTNCLIIIPAILLGSTENGCWNGCGPLN